MTRNALVAWPPSRFYWALLDTDSAGSASTRETLGYLFESRLPVPIEGVHAVFERVPGGIVACGLATDVLESDVPAETISLVPDALPEFLRETGLDPGRLNLLSGAFEPRRLRRSRRAWALQVAAILLIASLVVGLGMERRTAAVRLTAADARRAAEEAYALVLPGARSGGQPASVLLTAELRRLERTRTTPAGPAGSEAADGDVAPLLAEVLSAWPTDLHARTDAVVATSGGVTITAAVPDTGAADRLARGLGGLAAWSMQQPAVRQQRDEVTVTIRLEHAAKTEAQP